MKVELSIADDRELRQAIRDLIKGEVVSIARGEIKSILAEVVKEKTLPKTDAELNTLIVSEIRSIVRSELGSRTTFTNSSILQSLAREEIQKFIKESLTLRNLL